MEGRRVSAAVAMKRRLRMKPVIVLASMQASQGLVGWMVWGGLVGGLR